MLPPQVEDASHLLLTYYFPLALLVPVAAVAVAFVSAAATVEIAAVSPTAPTPTTVDDSQS